MAIALDSDDAVCSALATTTCVGVAVGSGVVVGSVGAVGDGVGVSVAVAVGDGVGFSVSLSCATAAITSATVFGSAGSTASN